MHSVSAQYRGVQVEWKRVKEGSYHGHAYEVFKGTFRTPCFGRIYDALPTESRHALEWGATAQLLSMPLPWAATLPRKSMY